MYFLNYVRILSKKNDGDSIKALENLRKTLSNDKVDLYYSVAEVSPQGLRHIHSILFFEKESEMVRIFNKIIKQNNPRYIDKVTKIVNEREADHYYRYVNKQYLEGENLRDPIPRVLKQNYICSGKDLLNFDKLNKIIFLKNTIDFDIFVPDD